MNFVHANLKVGPSLIRVKFSGGPHKSESFRLNFKLFRFLLGESSCRATQMSTRGSKFYA